MSEAAPGLRAGLNSESAHLLSASRPGQMRRRRPPAGAGGAVPARGGVPCAVTGCGTAHGP